ncbi:phosphatidylglycerol lysyltransferase domain-containing protein [Dactylosporangium sp. NPDC049140]|uniref:phosphatidylglycerol lysyltransferase domain-containing protein n=1 Tax=Dactylosporangium sp. NPDC049140 TaxID=3155647 RepID=UPI0033DB9E10
MSDDVPDRTVLRLGADATVLVCSDLHLEAAPTAATALMEADLAERLEHWDGPGAILFNGDTFELWGDPGGTVAATLDAHPRLAAAVRRFADEPGRAVVLLVGNHDGPIAWDGVSPGVLADRLGARCALAADLVLATPAGERVVRVEHGHGYDPANRFADPRNPLDSPLGQHVVQEVLPEARRTPLLTDLGSLADPNAIGRFVASRLVYRRLGPHAWWLLAPILLAAALHMPTVAHLLGEHQTGPRIARWVAFTGFGVLAEAVLLLGLALLVARAVYAAMAGSRFGPRGTRLNAIPKSAAEAMCGDGRMAGLVTGHTHQPELAAVEGGFYANTGSGTRQVEQRRARGPLPPVFETVLRRCWVELDVDRDVRVRLIVAESPAGDATGLERLALHRGPALPRTPEVVATLPGNVAWPLDRHLLAARARTARVRAVAAALVAFVALLGVVSAVTTPLRGRLAALLDVLPIAAPQAAGTAVVFVSAFLLLVAWGLRRGRRLAWIVAVALLSASALLHLIKGLDVEEAVVALAVAAWLAGHRAAFPVHPDHRQARRASVVLAAGGLATAALTAVLVAGAGVRGTDGRTAEAVAERLAGRTSVPLPAASPLIAPMLFATGLSLLLVVGWLLLRPRLLGSPSAADRRADRERARQIVAAHGGDTLGYFALRADKSWFFSGDCVVAYDVREGICLVSPDPIGPPEQHEQAWAQFTAFADRGGRPVTVVGAAEPWLPIYQAAGMHAMYLGDEAIVDCTAFSLDGRAMKSLRGSYNRVRKAGYSVRFHDPAALPADLVAELRALATQSRQGETERGFSMTLSRLFDPADTGLLLAVAYAANGQAAGFCQWIPAADIGGWSLDVMRRSTADDVPNGLTDFIIIETIRHLQTRGDWGLGLNFAVMRGVLAGVRGHGRLSELQRRILRRVGGSSQMETLWHFNDKYQPLWRPRYVVLDTLADAPQEAVAVAAAEGVTEVPVVGRLLGSGAPGAGAGRAGPDRG